MTGVSDLVIGPLLRLLTGRLGLTAVTNLPTRKPARYRYRCSAPSGRILVISGSLTLSFVSTVMDASNSHVDGRADTPSDSRLEVSLFEFEFEFEPLHSNGQ